MPQPFRFVHAADLHIDSPFRGLLEVSDAIAGRLREATFEAFQNLVDLCITKRSAFLVIAGDVYDGADRSVRAQLQFRDGLARLGENGIPSFIAHGNHDPLDGRMASIQLPEAAHTFGKEPEWVDVRDRAGGLLARLQGVSYETRVVEENLARRFTPPSDDAFTIGVLHCNVGGDPAHDNYAPCSIDDLASVGVDYWALGHVHARQVLREQTPTIAYPGNLQGRHANESGPRGALVVDVDAAGRAATQFVPLDVVRWDNIEVPIDDLADFDGLTDAVMERLVAARDRADSRDLVCRVRLTGRGPAHGIVRDPADLATLEEEIRRRTMSGRPWVWPERIVDGTRPAIDLDTRREQDDLLGLMLRRAAGMLDSGTVSDSVSEALRDVFGSRRFSTVLGEVDKDEILSMIDDARWVLAEAFEREA